MKTTENIMRHSLISSLLLLLLCLSSYASAGVTSLSMQSDPGDYIGFGQTFFYAPADGTFTAQVNYGNGVSVAFNTPGYEHWWYLDFAAADNQQLTVGTYQGAVRFPFQGAGQPGLSVYGDGRGCNTLTGSFNILAITLDPSNNVTSFWATFEQHCEGFTAALKGEIRINADVVVDVIAPGNVSAPVGQNLSVNVTATDNQNRHVTLSATGLPSGAVFTDNGDNTGQLTWTPDINQLGDHQIAFTGDNGQGTVQIVYTNITVIPPPPANDDIDGAAVISSLPYSTVDDTTNATKATDDPPCVGFGGDSVWFSFTPDRDMSITANTFGSNFDTTLSVFTGSRGNLSGLACNDDSNGVQSRITFNASAGITYYFMVASLGNSGGYMNFSVGETPPPPPPSVFFNFYPTDPSVYDMIQFCDYSFDPEQLGFNQYNWNFGDGSSTSGNCAQHQYLKDGDYTVTDSVTTIDGRTASATSLVQVRTHDVAITKLTAPTSARGGKTGLISAEVRNTRYAENVQVQLFKSDPSSYDGFQLVGTSIQQIPVRTATRTTKFSFNYTFSSSDAQIGKVTFKAVATIVGARDALIFDNVMISKPTKVTR